MEGEEFCHAHHPDTEEHPRRFTAEQRDEMRLRVWAMWCRGGTRNKTAIAREVGLSRDTVRDYIDQMQKRLLALVEDGDQRRADFFGELDQVQMAAWAEHATSDQESGRIGALNTIRNCLRDKARLLGLATERRVHTGPDGGPMAFVRQFDDMSDEQLALVAERLRNGTEPDNGDEGGGPAEGDRDVGSGGEG
jgi:hypothetical protein